MAAADILHRSRVRGVVQLISVADTPQSFSLQFKPCFGGNLYQAIGRKEFCQESHLCTKVIIPLLRVLEQLHGLGIIHRDIKPENVFFEGDGCLVLGDFGLAINSGTDKPCSRVGTTDYMAPEVMAQPSADLMAQRNIPRSLLRPYSAAVDTWALGVLVHEALTGRPPFCHPDPAVVALKVQFAAPCKLPGSVSGECQAFVDAVLHKQPGKRPSAAALLQHAWVQKHIAHAAPVPKPVSTAAPDCSTPATHARAAPAAAGSTACCAVASAPRAAVDVLDTAKASNNHEVVYNHASSEQQQLQPHKERLASVTASGPRRTVFEQRATITLPSKSSSCRIGGTSSSSSSSSEHDAVLKLELVPALSAPTVLLEPHIAAAVPPSCAPQPGTCGAAVAAGPGSSPASWSVPAAASAEPGPAGVDTGAEGPRTLRGSSWSPGSPGSCLAAAAAAAGTKAAAVMDAASCGKLAAAGKQQERVAVVGAMGAHRVPAAGACAAAAAAAAGASAAAVAAAMPSVRSLVSAVLAPPTLHRLPSSPVPAASGGCRSAELVLGYEGSTAIAAAAAAPAASCTDHTAGPLPAVPGPQGGRASAAITSGNSSSGREVPRHGTPCVLLARVPFEAQSVLQQVLMPQQSPNKACRVMRGVCKKEHAAGPACITPRPAALRVVAFRENDRQPLKRLDSLKMKSSEAKKVQRQGKQQLQKTRNAVNKRLPDAEAPVANNPTVYSINTAVLAVAAGLAASNPQLAAGILFKPSFLAAGGASSSLILPLMQILSLGWSAAAVTNFVQGDGTIKDDLDSTLHKRLNASLSTFSIAQLSLLGLLLTPLSASILEGVQGSTVLNQSGLLALGAGVAFQLYVAGVNYSRNAPEGYNPVADAKTWIKDAKNIFTGVTGGSSTGYAYLTAALLASGLGYIVAPVPTLQAVFGSSTTSAAGPESIILWQLIGAGVSMLVAPWALSLKEAAAGNLLSDVRYKLLNIGLLSAGVGHLLVLQPRLGDPNLSGSLLPVLVGTWAAAALLGGVGLLKRAQKTIR
ncbi:hypothetical protein COO60DRAFT_1641700 [Scenedesmus sp. NREL 46B-D3]|nr:hypothetical protein COO60DRAFT_1641700 [Scenedesmus sp. NREL 46B-D3]